MARVIQTIEVEIETETVYNILKAALPSLFEDVAYDAIAAIDVSLRGVRITYNERYHETRDEVPAADNGDPVTLRASDNSSPNEPSATLRSLKVDTKPSLAQVALAGAIPTAAALATYFLL